jgi:hypothetical protein
LLVAASVVPSSPILVTLKKEALGSSEPSVLTRATRSNFPEDTIFVAILFEVVAQEHQLRMQAIFITESSGSMLQSREYRFFKGWVMMGLGVEVEIGVCMGIRFILCPREPSEFMSLSKSRIGRRPSISVSVVN